MEACYSGHTDAVAVLLAAGAYLAAEDNEGDTALTYAAASDSAATVAALLDAGADLDHQNDFGATPLMFASTVGNIATVTALVNAGANEDLTRTFPDIDVNHSPALQGPVTALDLARYCQQGDIVSLLEPIYEEPPAGE